MDEKESLNIILEMVNKAKKSVNETGVSAILWGTVIGICGIFTFLQLHFNWQVGGFNIWYLTYIALLPQVYLMIKEKRKGGIKTHTQDAIDGIWAVYFISICCLIFYFNFAVDKADSFLAEDSKGLFIKDLKTGTYEPYQAFVPSFGSLFLLLYFIPTLATGFASRFKPMIIGGFLGLIFFAMSCFTSNKIDFLLQGLAGIFSWLIPGIILFRKYNQAKNNANV